MLGPDRPPIEPRYGFVMYGSLAPNYTIVPVAFESLRDIGSLNDLFEKTSAAEKFNSILGNSVSLGAGSEGAFCCYPAEICTGELQGIFVCSNVCDIV